jgi:hypothetical protein
MPYDNVGDCDGICPTRGTRCSPCPQLSTEDDRTPITLGMRLWNYYDGEWVTVTELPREYSAGWFEVTNDAGSQYTLNGVRTAARKP